VLSTTAQPEPHHAPHTFHVPGQSHRACTSSQGHESWSPQGPARIYVSILRHRPEYKSPCYMFILLPYALHDNSLYVYVLLQYKYSSLLYVFASSNINLATYFSLTRSHLLKLLLSLTLDSPTLSGPPKFEASIKRAAQPTSWSQRLAQLWTQHLHPNSKLNRRKTAQPPSNCRLSSRPLIQEKWSPSTLSWTVEPPESSSTATMPRATGSTLGSSPNPFRFTTLTELRTRLVPSLKWWISSWDTGIIQSEHYLLSLA